MSKKTSFLKRIEWSVCLACLALSGIPPAHAIHRVAFMPPQSILPGGLVADPGAEGMRHNCGLSCMTWFLLYDAADVERLATQLRAETAGVRTELITQVADVQHQVNLRQQQIDQALANQSRKIEGRVATFEHAVFESLNHFDQRILNQEVIRAIREEMKQTIRDEVSRQLQSARNLH